MTTEEVSAILSNHLEAAQSGDSLAIDAMIEAAYPIVYRFCYHLARNREDAEDLSQTVSMRFLNALPRLRALSGARLTSYLYRCAYNAFLDEARKKRALPMPESYDAPSDERSPLDRVVSQEVAQDVQALLATLNDELRAMVLLRYMEDLSYAEIASAMHTTQARVKWKLHGALEKMRKRGGAASGW